MRNGPWIWLWSPVFLTGCAVGGNPAVDEPERVLVAPPAELSAGQAEDFVFALAARTLRERGFLIDREDRSFGRIVTVPRTAGALLELWRRDSIGVENWVEGSLNKIRRIVTVAVRRPVQGADWSLQATATTERFADTGMREFGAAELIGRFQTRGASLGAGSSGTSGGPSSDLQERPDGEWVQLGRDRRLEQALADGFREAAAEPAKRPRP